MANKQGKSILDFEETVQNKAKELLSQKSTNTGDCVEWKAGKDKDGYGIIGVTYEKNKSHSFRAHRVAYELAAGRIPHPLILLHSCDNPSCINPDHLRPGTEYDNRVDCKSKDRSIRGERNHKAQLTRDQVSEIKTKMNQKAKLVDLAKEYSVSVQLVARIKMEQTWEDVEPKIDVKRSRRPLGEDHGRAKLNNENVATIKAALAAGTTVKDLAQQFDVSIITIRGIRRGLQWSHVPAATS
jgi:hypothetical protein